MSFVINAVKSVFKAIVNIFDPPDPPTPPQLEIPVLEKDDTAAIEAAAKEKRRRRLAGGLRSTILTSGEGVIGDEANAQPKTLLGA